MYNTRSLEIVRKIINSKNFIWIQRALYSTKEEFLFPENERFPYTKALVKKNYLRYSNESILKVDHDHVYTGHERLPSLEERLKG